jgi:XisI protein
MAVDHHQIVAEYLRAYCSINQRPGDNEQLVMDHERGHYLLIHADWEGQKRIYNVIMHIDVTASKVWIQRNQTERDIEAELIGAGVAAQDIVLELVPPEYRALAGKP